MTGVFGAAVCRLRAGQKRSREGIIMDHNNTDIKVPLISKIAYGMGDVGCNFSWMFVGK